MTMGAGLGVGEVSNLAADQGLFLLLLILRAAFVGAVTGFGLGVG